MSLLSRLTFRPASQMRDILPQHLQPHFRALLALGIRRPDRTGSLQAQGERRRRRARLLHNCASPPGDRRSARGTGLLNLTFRGNRRRRRRANRRARRLETSPSERWTTTRSSDRRTRLGESVHVSIVRRDWSETERSSRTKLPQETDTETREARPFYRRDDDHVGKHVRLLYYRER